MYKIGVCKNCNIETYIVNAHKTLCKFCNQKRLSRNSEKPNIKKVYRKKPTGEKDLFLEIWNERSHTCINCSRYLGLEAKTFYFSHIKPKSTHPHLRLDKTNIQLLCFDCHYLFDNSTKANYDKKKRN